MPAFAIRLSDEHLYTFTANDENDAMDTFSHVVCSIKNAFEPVYQIRLEIEGTNKVHMFKRLQNALFGYESPICVLELISIWKIDSEET